LTLKPNLAVFSNGDSRFLARPWPNASEGAKEISFQLKV